MTFVTIQHYYSRDRMLSDKENKNKSGAIMQSLLRRLKQNSVEIAENKLVIEFKEWAISNGYNPSIVDMAIDQTIMQGSITKVALLANLSDKNIKANK